MRSFKRLHCGRRDGAKSRKQRLLPCFDRSGGRAHAMRAPLRAMRAAPQRWRAGNQSVTTRSQTIRGLALAILGTTWSGWVAGTLRQILAEPPPNAHTPPETFSR